MVKWSTCWPITPTIRVRISLKPTVFYFSSRQNMQNLCLFGTQLIDVDISFCFVLMSPGCMNPNKRHKCGSGSLKELFSNSVTYFDGNINRSISQGVAAIKKFSLKQNASEKSQLQVAKKIYSVFVHTLELFVAQMEQRSLPTPEIPGSNPVMGKFYMFYNRIENTKIRKEAHFLKI